MLKDWGWQPMRPNWPSAGRIGAGRNRCIRCLAAKGSNMDFSAIIKLFKRK
jgi:hypothetical protein